MDFEDETLPQYEDDGSERVFYPNIWRNIEPQEILGADCFVPDAPIAATDNKLVLVLTEQEFTEMFSALYNGAELTYPDKHLQIVVNFLKGLHCPPEMEDEGGCINFKPYASFITYEEQNPFNEPDLVPEGYLVPPFHYNNDLAYPELLGYTATDVMVVPASVPVFGDWGDLIALHFPTIKIFVQGEGQVEVDFLSVALGGQCIVKVGSPPNILDIVDGIIETGVKVIDLGQDITAIPPESDIVIAEEIAIDAPEGTYVYFVFVPKLDVSTEFFGMGGGIRQIGLCGLETDGTTMGIEDIKWVYQDPPEGETWSWYKLQKRVAGVWEDLEMGNDVGYWMMENARVAHDAWNMIYALRNLQDFDSWWNGDFQGWNPSPIKTYIDATAGDAFDPSALEAAVAAAQSDAEAAAAAAAAAQSTANGAVTVNNTQNSAITAIQATNTAQGISIDDLQERLDTAETNIDGLQVYAVATGQRIEDLDSGGAWHKIHDFTVSDCGYTADFGDYSPIAGVGWQPDTTDIYMNLPSVTYANQITHLQVAIETFGAIDPEIRLGWEVALAAAFDWKGNGNISTAWIRVPNQAFGDFVKFRVLIDNGTFAIKYARYLGRGENPFP